jgi:hypothetical protein
MRAAAVAVGLFLAGSLLIATQAGGGHAASGKNVIAAIRLLPEAGSSVRGAAFFRQRDRRLSGWVVVWGLRPRTAHAVHFHAPGRCGGAPADPIAAHNDLLADADGVAYAAVSIRVRGTVLRRGVYYNVHQRGAAAGKTPSLACGDVRPESNGG